MRDFQKVGEMEVNKMYEDRPVYSEQYAPPPGGAPTGYRPHIENNTEKGVRFYFYSILIIVIALFLTFIIAVISYITISSIDFDEKSDVDTAMDTLIMIGTIACVALLLLIIHLIMCLIGMVNILRGRAEFPGKHPGSASVGAAFTILYVIFFILTLLLPFLFVFMIDFTGTPKDVWDSIRMWTMIIVVISLLTNLFMGLMYVFMIKEIAQPSIKKLLWVGFILLIMAGIISLAVTSIALSIDVGDLSSSELQALSSGADAASNIGSIASIIGVILLFICYWKTLKSLQIGELQPSTGLPPLRSRERPRY